jgi:hypothetical protein
MAQIKRNYTDKNSLKYFSVILIFIFLLCFISCSKKEEKPVVTDNKQQSEQNQNTQAPVDDTAPADTNLTPEEKFSSSVMADFLDGSEDEDLAGFLEDEVFKYSNNYTGAAIIGLSSSTWLLALEKDNTTRNYIIQKYVDFKTNDYYFRMNETNLKITDAILQNNSKAGN